MCDEGDTGPTDGCIQSILVHSDTERFFGAIFKISS